MRGNIESVRLNESPTYPVYDLNEVFWHDLVSISKETEKSIRLSDSQTYPGYDLMGLNYIKLLKSLT